MLAESWELLIIKNIKKSWNKIWLITEVIQEQQEV